jgi:hypothetical protein
MNVILSLLISALVAGLLSSIGLSESMSIFIGGMGGNAQTALSYILLGALAAAITETGLATILSKKIASMIKGKGIVLLILLALIAAASGTIIPVHIAFIPILIPPLLVVMNKLKMDRRAASCALALGLKAPYISIPIGYGLIFHTIIADNMTENGMAINNLDVYKTTWILGIAMIIGFLIAVLITYRKPREYKDDEEFHSGVSVSKEEIKMTSKHYIAMIGAVSTLVVQLKFGSMPLGALSGLLIIIIGRAVEWKKIDSLMFEGIKLMGFIAFVMLVASGYGAVMRATGGIDTLVAGATGLVGGSKFMAALVMLLIGLFITMGIGTSFGTVPILAVIYVPFALEVGFSVGATALLIATAAALGDAGSPASDTTLGPSAGLSADGQHDHIWDTCVPQFLHYNIPLVLMGLIGAMIF